jgi:PAS domain S-box-containing protein
MQGHVQGSKVNILLVDDQPAKLLSYEVILGEIGENLIKASSGREAMEHLLKSEIAVVLMDVCMPELDGFELASMLREHPRFRNTAIIFISAIHLTDTDRLRGYEMGAVDYVPIPVVPQVLCAKVKIFVELYRKSRELERLNAELERRVADRTAALEQSTRQLQDSEERRSLALAAGKMGSWDWDVTNGDCVFDDSQKAIFGVPSDSFRVTPANLKRIVHPDDWHVVRKILRKARREAGAYQAEFRIMHADGGVRWLLATAAASRNARARIARISGVIIDITDRKEAEEHQSLLAREVDHRAKNALAVVHAIVCLSRCDSVDQYVAAVEGRIQALARAHSLLSESRWQGANMAQIIEEELAPYRSADFERVSISGQAVSLEPSTAQAVALAVHELATNAAKYGALSSVTGHVQIAWTVESGFVSLRWSELGGPVVHRPSNGGFGIRVITSSVEGQPDGKVEFEWREQGLSCSIRIPHKLRAELPEQTAQPSLSKKAIAAPVDCARRVLLLEDESLIALMTAQTLTDLGVEVIGPFGKVAEALAAIEREPIDFAILDMNLGGEMADPIAVALRSRGIPFAFVTGYGSEVVTPRFPDVAVLQKPVERDVLERILAATFPATRAVYERSALEAPRSAATRIAMY